MVNGFAALPVRERLLPHRARLGENAALYIEFLNRVASGIATFMESHTVRDYEALHELRITHVYETFYVLFIGLASYLRNHPDADDEVLKGPHRANAAHGPLIFGRKKPDAFVAQVTKGGSHVI